MFESILLQIVHPDGYTAQHLRLQAVHFMATHARMFFGSQRECLQAVYGLPVAPGEEAHGGPFSYHGYLMFMLDDTAWGDSLVLMALSMMFGVRISLVSYHGFTVQMFRHSFPDFHGVDILLFYNGRTHYSALGELFLLHLLPVNAWKSCSDSLQG
jgi:hypothetical protein